jgi:eukaryotic-like serine/threonine-protein kinase
MKSEHRDAKVIFGEALRLSLPAERAAYLDQACAGDLVLRREVESLLSAYAQAGDFLNQTCPLPAPDLLIERTGTMIGRYKLLEKIGEGGFGVIYMAEQREPVQRKVALKIIKAGMDTKEVIARFEAERQALALMDHPNISKVLDGGATEAGRPYFVMELVNGIPITDYCDQKNLPTAERLQLFIKVCHAVQHAHQKGIIHRDLKPTNVLVTLHDGEPVPKVIDFGVAKALGQKLTQKTFFTAFQHMIGTPAYMSPEQAELSGLDVDTRSDIYSLGALLYELLTGATPFAKETLAKAALDELRRIIRDTEPLKPSTRLRTLGDDLAEVAKRRDAEPAALNRLVRGDLDWIVMKCLEKDRARRYETANGLALDIQRHMTHEPVTAAAPSTLYQAQKFVRRHRTGLAMAVALVVLLAAGVFASRREAVRATRAERAQVLLRQRAEADEQKAETEAAKSRQVAQFLKDMLKSVAPSVALGRDATMLKEILEKTAERAGKDLTNQAEVRAELCSVIGNTYLELQDYPKAEEMHREALRLRSALFGETNQFVAASIYELGVVLFEKHGPDIQQCLNETESLFRQALRIRRELNDRSRETVYCLGYLGMTLVAQGERAEAEKTLREAVQMAETLGADTPEVALALTYLAQQAHDRGAFPEGEAMTRRALAIRRNCGAADDAICQSLVFLAIGLRDEGKLSESEAVRGEALALFEQLSAKDRPHLDLTLGAWSTELANLFISSGKLAQAEIVLRADLANAIKLWGIDHPAAASARRRLISVLLDEQKFSEAEVLLHETEKAIAARRKSAGDDLDVAAALSDISFLFRQAGRLPKAEATARETLAIRKQLLGEEHRDVAWALHLLAWNLHLQGRDSEAEALSRQELALWHKLLGKDHPNMATCLQDLAQFLRDQRKLADAEGAIRECLTIREKKDRNHPDLAFDFNLLTELLRAQGKLAEIREVYRRKAEAGGLEAKNDYARFLTTCKDPGLGDVTNAVTLAERIVAATGRTNLLYLTTLAAAYAQAGRSAEANAMAREAAEKYHTSMARYEKLASDPNRHHECWSFADAYEAIGGLLKQIGQTQEAEKVYQDAQALWRKLVREDPGNSDYTKRLGQSHWGLAEVLAKTGRTNQAEKVLREALQVFEQATRDFPAELCMRQEQAYSRRSLADVFSKSGRIDEAEREQRAAIALYAGLKAAAPANPWYCQEEAYTTWMLASMLEGAGRLDAAEVEYRHAIGLQEKARADFPSQGVFTERLGTIQRQLVELLRRRGKPAEANATVREGTEKYHTSMAQYEKLASDPNRHHACWSFAISYEVIAGLLKEIGQPQEAEKAYQDTQVLWRKLVANFNTEDHRFHLAANYEALGHLLRQAGRATESLESFRAAQAIWLKLVAESNVEDHRNHLGWTGDDIGQSLQQAGRLEEAAESFRQALAVWKKLDADFSKDAYRNRVSGTLVSLARTLQNVGKRTEAEPLFREAAEHASAGTLNELAWQLATDPDPKLRNGAMAVLLAEKAVSGPNQTNPIVMDTLAAAYAEAGQFTNAVRVQQEAIALLQNEQQKKDFASRLRLYDAGMPYRNPDSSAQQATTLLANGKCAEAEPLARECLAIREKQIPDDWRTFNARSLLGGSLLGQKKHAEAEPLLLAAYEGMKQREARIPMNGRPRLKETLQRLVQLYDATGRPDQAAEWKQRLADFEKAGTDR